jgi:hypothetical protein
MSALLAGLLANPTILAIIAGVLGALGWGFHQRLAGAKAERAKQAADQLDAIKDRKDKDDEINSLAPADVDNRLDKWLRDK